jgi:hypothetical protein
MIKSLILFALISVVSLGIWAQFKPHQMKISAAGATTARTEAAPAEKDIRQILERYYEIAGTNDREALKTFSQQISVPEYKYSSELGVMDKTAAIRYFEALDLEFVTAGFEELTIQVHGENAAVAKYRDVSTVKTNGVVMKKPMQFTNVWVKQNGEWKIVAEHSSVAAPRELLPRKRFADDLARK